MLHVPSLLLIANKKKGDSYLVTSVPPPPTTTPPTYTPLLPVTTPTWLAAADPEEQPTTQTPITTCIATRKLPVSTVFSWAITSTFRNSVRSVHGADADQRNDYLAKLSRGVRKFSRLSVHHPGAGRHAHSFGVHEIHHRARIRCDQCKCGSR